MLELFDFDLVLAIWAAVSGAVIGSFLNVVVYRLPVMMERQWVEDCDCANQAAKGIAADMPPGTTLAPVAAQPTAEAAPKFNLMVPASRCGSCGHAIRWFENIPIASYLVLRGQCSACNAPISLRYPAVELACGVLGGYCAYRWGMSWAALAWFGFSACLLGLALIDWDTTLLPDDMTLPLLWAGLLASQFHWTPVPLADALWGAVGGYLSLWSVYWVFKLVTQKEGMGYGDFKLLAGLGAWFGWQALIPIILMASVIGAIVGVAMKFTTGLREGGYVPFGPFLAGAGLTAMVWGPQTLLRSVGLAVAP
jgi:leader peptidase (prepilin peptidase) / N-methyltransferase